MHTGKEHMHTVTDILPSGHEGRGVEFTLVDRFTKHDHTRIGSSYGYAIRPLGTVRPEHIW